MSESQRRTLTPCLIEESGALTREELMTIEGADLRARRVFA